MLPNMISGKTVNTCVSNLLGKLSLLAAKSLGYAETVYVTIWTKYVTCAAPRGLEKGFAVGTALYRVYFCDPGVVAMPSYSIVVHTYHVDSTTYARKDE
jgi:hypothetical protein